MNGPGAVVLFIIHLCHHLFCNHMICLVVVIREGRKHRTVEEERCCGSGFSPSPLGPYTGLQPAPQLQPQSTQWADSFGIKRSQSLMGGQDSGGLGGSGRAGLSGV